MNYDKIAYYYDLEYSPVTADLDFFKELARQAGAKPRILELACGTGRITLPLLRAGFRITGLDSSEGMLELAHQKLAKEPLDIRERGRFVHGDMREFNLEGEQFDLIFIGLNSFQHLLTQTEQLACLQAARAHLAPAGLFVVDIYNPEEKENYPADGRLELSATVPKPEGGSIYIFHSTTAEPTEQQRHYTFMYDDTAADGTVKRTVFNFSLRYTYRYELQLLLEKAGFSVVDFYGSYEFDQFGPDSGKLIYLCRRG